MKKTSLPKDKQLSEKEILQHEFLTIAEVALLLRVTERTIYNFIYAGTLKAHKITSRITIIPKSNFLEMLRLSEYNKKATTEQPEGKNNASSAVQISASPCSSELSKPSKPRKRSRSLKPTSDYKQSVKDTFKDEGEISGPVYTMEEICRKFNYSYGKFYNLRMRYSIPCVKMEGHKCFPCEAVDRAMAEEKERLGQDLSKDWYSCFDLMKKYGLGKTQVRRFALTHGVRTKKVCNRKMYYLKADWDAARKLAEQKSASTKTIRE